MTNFEKYLKLSRFDAESGSLPFYRSLKGLFIPEPFDILPQNKFRNKCPNVSSYSGVITVEPRNVDSSDFVHRSLFRAVERHQVAPRGSRARKIQAVLG